MMTQRELAVGDTILVELDEGDRIKGTIRERTSTHATVHVEKQFDIDSNLQPKGSTSDNIVITLNDILKVFD